MGIQIIKLASGAADASGDATATTSNPVNGIIRAIELVYTASSDAGTDTVITEEGNTTDTTILSLTNANTNGWFYPHNYPEDVAGADLTYDGTEEIAVPFYVSRPLTITIADQTEDYSVTAYIYVEK